MGEERSHPKLASEPWRKEKKGGEMALLKKGDTPFPGAASRDGMEILSILVLNF